MVKYDKSLKRFSNDLRIGRQFPLETCKLLKLLAQNKQELDPILWIKKNDSITKYIKNEESKQKQVMELLILRGTLSIGLVRKNDCIQCYTTNEC